MSSCYINIAGKISNDTDYMMNMFVVIYYPQCILQHVIKWAIYTFTVKNCIYLQFTNYNKVTPLIFLAISFWIKFFQFNYNFVFYYFNNVYYNFKTKD